MKTPYSDSMDKNHPLAAHPDPYWERMDFLSLNGLWDFQITKEKDNPDEYTEKILVPFSPETPLSGIQRHIGKTDYLHYRKVVSIDDKYVGKVGLLRFMAVDQECDVYIDGEKKLSHKGGYSSFSLCVCPLKKEFVLEVSVHDDTSSSVFARGKQSNEAKGIWYTPTSGIYQEVYLEFLDSLNYLESCSIHGDFDRKKLIFDGKMHGNFFPYKISVFFKDKLVGESFFDSSLHAEIDLSSSFHPWSNKEANLYKILFTSKNGDEISSHYGIRKIERRKVNGFYYLFLNNEPLYLSGLLDQGYYPDGGLTPPSIDAMRGDILLAKKCGFNSLRKHIKIELRRWYYLCDQEGIIVIQDFVNGGAKYSELLINLAPFLPLKISDKNPILGRRSQESKDQFLREMEETVHDLGNIPSICIWTLFNEGWGQFDTKKCYALLQELDSSRLIDATSGWYDKKIGDFHSRHIYFRPVHLFNHKKRLMSLSEFGGYVAYVKNHSWSRKSFGYKNYSTLENLNEGLAHLFKKEVRRAIKHARLCLSVYTQLTDVEEEVNGLITYDREVVKVDTDRLRKINDELYEEYQSIYQKDKKSEKN
mgnify:FL=1